MQKTKWQELLDAPKGCKEYNPNQFFVLQVYWIVRSPAALHEMISKGFEPCAQACKRDTPATLAYFFRKAKDQSLATKYYAPHIQTLGQHPHYQPSFKSLQMGIPLPSVQLKLKTVGIDSAPLALGAQQEFTQQLKEQYDFEPCVLECTEVYLDNRSFIEHSSSRDWMLHSQDILRASSSLKPTTYCLGQPTKEVWEKIVEPTLKAIKIESTGNTPLQLALKPGVYFGQFGTVAAENAEPTPIAQQQEQQKETAAPATLSFEIDCDFIDIANQIEKVATFRELLGTLQKELSAPYLIVIPNTLEEKVSVATSSNITTVRAMLCSVLDNSANSVTALQQLCQQFPVQIRATASTSGASGKAFIESQCQSGAFVRASEAEQAADCANITIVDLQESIQAKEFAGYVLHPKYNELVANAKINYQL